MTTRTPLTLAIVLAFSAASGGCAETQRQRQARDLQVLGAEATPQRLRARGEAAAMAGDLTRAEQYFVAALRAGGDERLLTERLLIVCVTDGRFPAAASYAEDYLSKHPADTDVRYAVATVYFALGNLDASRAELDRVLRARPDMADAHYTLATVLRKLGDSSVEADRHLREYIRLEPNGAYAEAAKDLLLKGDR